MTCLTIEIAVQSDQRKPRGLVHLFERAAVNPFFGSVTLRAVIVKLAAMHICMTIETLGAGIRKDQSRMALDAAHASVTTDQWELRLSLMIERTFLSQLFPTRRSMADLAVDRNLPVRTLLREEGLSNQERQKPAEP